MYCHQCGHRNEADANFCSMCGTPLVVEGGEASDTAAIATQSEPQAEPDVDLSLTLEDVGEDNAVLVVKRGPNAGSKYVVSEEVTRIGRHPDSDLFLDDVTVSRRHAEVRRRDGRFTLRDVGSLNGTYVNSERVEEAALENGDEVRIGKYVIIFLEGE